MSYSIFIDVDGTLIDHFMGRASDKVTKALLKAHDNGAKIYLCSGRSRIMMMDHYRPEYMDGFICCDGAYIEVQGKVLEESVIDQSLVNRIIELAEKTGTGLTLQAYDCNYRNQTMSDFFKKDFEKEHPGERNEYELRLNVKQLSHYTGEKIYKIDAKFLDDSDKDQFIKELPEEVFMIGMLSTQKNSTSGGEITMKNASKGNAVKSVLSFTNEALENSYGIGDSMNDKSMIKACGHGIAMGNGQDELKKCADFVTDTVQEDGVVKALEYYHLI